MGTAPCLAPTPRRTLAALITITTAALLAGTACATPGPAASPTGSGSAGIGGAPTTTPPPAAPTYPTPAKEDAQAVLAAWKANNLARLADLTTNEVNQQIIAIPG